MNMLQPGTARTFSDYEKQVFLPYIRSQLSYVNRLWDEYCLKAETRTKKGKGIRRRVEPSSTIPGKWQEFLRIDASKVELFSFLANRVTTIGTEKQIISTLCDQVLGSSTMHT